MKRKKGQKGGNKMYQKILVPLDGSELAECVLPHVKAIAGGCGTEQVVLLKVVEPLPAEINDERVRNHVMKAAEDYLVRIQAKLNKAGLAIETQVLTGIPAETISDFAQRNKVDLIALATHGRSGISRWVFGSVADKLVRSSSVPILLIRPKSCESGT
jgi:nucleotide-binding universal stress UspA family protein